MKLKIYFKAEDKIRECCGIVAGNGVYTIHWIENGEYKVVTFYQIEFQILQHDFSELAK